MKRTYWYAATTKVKRNAADGLFTKPSIFHPALLPEGVKLRFKILMKQNYPLHGNTMLFKPYVVKYIFETHFLASLGNISALQALLNGGRDVWFAPIFGQVHPGSLDPGDQGRENGVKPELLTKRFRFYILTSWLDRFA